MSEELENARRMAERGLKMAQTPPMESSYIDTFQHILDKIALVKKEIDRRIDALSLHKCKHGVPLGAKCQGCDRGIYHHLDKDK